jgi:glyoxylase-like metal-dependent hydrolase (beta-lactamase superfamily II)
MSKAFASQADLTEKTVSFDQLSDHAFAYTAEGDPNTGILVTEAGVLVADAQATPVMAQDVIRRIRGVTDQPIKTVVLTHYHAVRVLGASAYGAQNIIASQDTRDLIVERGAADMKSEIERFPRLFRAVESVPGLTWPTITFKGEMTLWMGSLEVKLMQLGRGHTRRSCSAAISWSSTPRPMRATPTSATGRPRSMRSLRSSPRSWCPAAARR